MILGLFTSTGKKASTASTAINLALECRRFARKSRRYSQEPRNVAPRYAKTIIANEYTCVFSTGVNARVHTTSIAIATKPVENKIHLIRSEEHTSELQSLRHLVCRL